MDNTSRKVFLYLVAIIIASIMLFLYDKFFYAPISNLFSFSATWFNGTIHDHLILSLNSLNRGIISAITTIFVIGR